MSDDLGLMLHVRNADDIAQYVRHCTIRGSAFWGFDFPMDTKALRYPLVIYLYNPWRSGAVGEGVQAYGTVTRVISGAKPTPSPNLDLVPTHLRQESHTTWLQFDQILNVTPAVSHTEFFSPKRERLALVPKDAPVTLGPPYPLKRP